MSVKTKLKPVPRIHDLGSALRKRRIECGLTQAELAWRAELHWTYVSHLENARRHPGWRVICALSEALEIRPSVLVRNAEDLPSRGEQS